MRWKRIFQQQPMLIVVGGMAVGALLGASRRAKRRSSKPGKKPTSKGLTEREARLGLTQGDEALVAKIRARWTPLAAQLHVLYPNVPIQRILEFIHHESGGNPEAFNKGSQACGLGQMTPAAQETYHVKNCKDPYDNLEGATHFLSDLTREYGDDLSYIAAAYVGGKAGQVKKQFAQGTYDFTGYTGQYVARAHALRRLYNEVP